MFHIIASTAINSMHMMMRRPIRFTRYRPVSVARVREGAPQSPFAWYQRGLIRTPLRKIGVILLHDVEHCFLGEPAMVLGK